MPDIPCLGPTYPVRPDTPRSARHTPFCPTICAKPYPSGPTIPGQAQPLPSGPTIPGQAQPLPSSPTTNVRPNHQRQAQPPTSGPTTNVKANHQHHAQNTIGKPIEANTRSPLCKDANRRHPGTLEPYKAAPAGRVGHSPRSPLPSPGVSLRSAARKFDSFF